MLQLNALHGEHYLELLNPLPRSARLVTKPQLIDIQDKGSGAVAILQSVTVDAVTNQSIAINEFTTFVKGAGARVVPVPQACARSTTCWFSHSSQQQQHTDCIHGIEHMACMRTQGRAGLYATPNKVHAIDDQPPPALPAEVVVTVTVMSLLPLLPVIISPAAASLPKCCSS